MAKKIIIAYVPVIHRGYRQFLEANPAYHDLYLLGRDVTDNYRPLQKEIRALLPSQARQALLAWNLLDSITVADQKTLQQLATQNLDILMPEDEASTDIAERFFQHKKVQFYPIFLRWDRRRAEEKQPIDAELTVTEAMLDQQFMRMAHAEGFKSSDIWRRLGALIVKDGEIITLSHNKNRPHEHNVWLNGDPRGSSSQGNTIEISVFQHAESCVIADCARRGIALEGADLYVSVFPCPACAMLIAYSGIKRLFFAQGYAMLDGQKILQEQGVQIIRVKTDLIDDRAEVYVPYPKE